MSNVNQPVIRNRKPAKSAERTVAMPTVAPPKNQGNLALAPEPVRIVPAMSKEDATAKVATVAADINAEMSAELAKLRAELADARAKSVDSLTPETLRALASEKLAEDKRREEDARKHVEYTLAKQLAKVSAEITGRAYSVINGSRDDQGRARSWTAGEVAHAMIATGATGIYPVKEEGANGEGTFYAVIDGGGILKSDDNGNPSNAIPLYEFLNALSLGGHIVSTGSRRGLRFWSL